MTRQFLPITLVNHGLLKISGSKLNHMRLVLHNPSAKERLGVGGRRLRIEGDASVELDLDQAAFATVFVCFFVRNYFLSCMEKNPYKYIVITSGQLDKKQTNLGTEKNRTGSLVDVDWKKYMM